MSNSQQTSVDDTTQDAAEKRKQEQRQQSEIERKVRKKADQELKKEMKKASKKVRSTMFKSVFASAGVTIFSIIILLFMLIGIVAFLLTMPGLTQNGISELVSSIVEKTLDNAHGGKEHLLETEEIKNNTLEALKYMDKMGLDPVGLGFVQKVTRDSNGEINGFNEDYNQYANNLKINPSGDMSDSNLIVTSIPSACPLFGYVISNERTYLPQEYYVKSDKMYGELGTLLNISAEKFEKYRGFMTLSPLGGFIGFVIGTANSVDEEYYVKQDDGMLVYDKEKGVKIDRENRTMEYSASKVSNGALLEQSYTVDLESWIGRYGMPLEFLTALHMATMTSDITQEFISDDDLKTQVHISFDQGTYHIDFNIQIKDDEGNVQQLPITFGNIGDKKLVELLTKYQYVKVQYNEKKGKYEYVFDAESVAEEPEFTSSAVTICSLKELIDELKMSTTYLDDDVKKKYEGVDSLVEEGIGELLYGDNDIFLKYDINFGTFGNTAETEAYIGTYKDGKATGFLREAGDGTYTNSNLEDGKTAVVNPNEVCRNGLYQGEEVAKSTTPNISKVNVNAASGDNAYRTIVRIPSFKSLAESELSLNIINSRADIRDAITCYMLEIDQYFSEKSWGAYDNEAEHTVGISLNRDGNSSQVIITGDDGLVHTMNFTNYNYYLRDADSTGCFSTGATVDIPGYYTQKWLWASRDGLSADEVQDLINELSKSYNEVEDIDNNVKNVLDGIWRNVVDSSAEECPLSAEDINQLYNILYDYTKGAQEMKMAFPKIEKVVHHWFKDLDFKDAYGTGSNTRNMPAYESEDGKIVATAILTSDEFATQTQQPYVIKGNVVTLDGEEVDVEYGEDSEFGKGYEASKKILTAGYYYVYDGTETSSDGILYNKILEGVKPGNIVEVTVNDMGSISNIKALRKNGNTFYGTKTEQQGDNTVEVDTNIASVNGNSVGWYVTGEITKMKLSNCVVIHYNDVDWVNARTTTNPDTGEEETISEVVGQRHKYYVYVGESMEYISAVEDIAGAELSKDKINELLEALGVSQIRRKVTFDNTTPDGNVVALTAFSILEGMKTESAQLIYRDLKEFLIELGYYTKAEFDYLSNNCLEWFIPDYIPDNPERWRQNKDEDIIWYGAILYPDSEFMKTTEQVEDTQEENNGDEGDNTQEEGEGTVEEVEETTEENENTTNESESAYSSSQRGFTPGLDVIAPGNARIMEYSTDEADPFIKLEFDGVTDPKIAMLDRYTMTIRGISVETTLYDPEDESSAGVDIDKIIEDKTIIKVNTVIGKTGDRKIQVVLQNANGGYLSNVEDYMHPELYDINDSASYTGSLSQQFYYYLGHELEGLKYTSDEYFTHANGNVSGGGDNSQGYITVGPGLLMDDGKLATYVQKGGERVDNRSINSKYRKDIILEMFIEYTDGVFKAKVEELLDGYEVSQTQMEALVLACYQRGTGSDTLKQIINKIKAGATADELESIWVVPYSKGGYPGVYARRYAEWYLYKHGIYIEPYSNSHSAHSGPDTEFNFGSDTPWEDFVSGK